MGRRRVFRISIALAVIGAVVFAALYNGIFVRRYTIETDKLSEPVRAVLLADLHSGFFGENQEKLIKKIDAQKPDIILMSGDIADYRHPNDGAIALLDGIAHKYPCFYVTGNHEIWNANFGKEVKAIMREYGVVVLDGDLETVSVNGQMINICGVDDPQVGTEAYNTQLDRVRDRLNGGIFTIFMAHRPDRVYQYPQNCLITAGHAHGGEWRVPFIINGLYAPNQGWFPEYTGGKYTVGNKTMIVSRGFAQGNNLGIPRIFNPPEIVVIDIKGR
ncbi:MAG: metallophosphoesterase [Oscillospiraceae bacterium]|nr:metallophosphoesterase [Oscillospiraceae bacterium]